MPVARILTRFPERTNALAEDLHHRGYTVEIGVPGETGLTPADLEIDFEICNNEEALQRASELARHWSADVAVSPGVGDLTVAAQPVAAEAQGHDDEIIVIPPAQVEAPSAPQAPAMAIAPEEQVIAPEIFVSSAEMPAGPPTLEKHEIAEPAAMSDTEHIPSQELADFSAEEPRVVRMPSSYQAEQDINLIHERAAVEIAGEPRRFEAEPEPISEAEVARPDYAQKTREISAAALNSGKALAVSSGEWLRKNSESLRQQIDLKRAEMRARRAVRKEQAEQRKAVAQERAAELEAAREAAAARLQELLRERGGLVNSQPAPPQVHALDDPQLDRRMAAGGATSFFRRHLGFSFHSGISPQLEAVLMGVAAACALFVLGLAVASFHAAPAISKTVNVPQQQYNGVTVQTGGVTLKPSTASTTPVRAAAPTTNNVAANASKSTARPSAGRPSPAKGRTSSERGNVNTRHIGDDVVIRRLDQPKPGTSHSGGGSDVTIRQLGSSKPATGNTSAGPKKISDMD